MSRLALSPWILACLATASAAAQTQFSAALARPSPFGSDVVGFAAAAGDLDGDGDTDFVFATHTGVRVFVREAAGFRDVSATLPGTSAPFGSVQLVDVDGDRDLDVILLAHPSFGATALSTLWRNEGRMQFTARPTAFPAGTNAVSAAVMDVDGDGDLDVVTASWVVGAGRLVALGNDGTGTFTPLFPAGFAVPAGFVTALVAADLDGDTDVDLVVGGSQQLGWLENLRGSFVYRPLALDTAQVVAVGDLDGDGFPEVAASGSLAQAVLLYQGSALGPRRAQPTFGPVTAPALLAFVDVDGDGVRDVAFAELAVGSVPRAWRHDGRMNFTPFRDGALRLSSGSATAWIEADVDGDGANDLVQLAGGARFAADVTVLLRTRTGFVDVGSSPFGGASPHGLGPMLGRAGGIASGDVDADGDVDLLFGSRVGWNDGGGRFALGNGTLAAVRPLLIDVDGDGDLDRVEVGTAAGVELRVLRNDGRGNFDLVFVTPCEFVAGILAADFDRDGRVDVFVADQNGRHLHLRGAAAPTWFVDVSPALPVAFEFTSAATLVDADRDGDMDVVLGNVQQVASAARSRLLRNDGGTFVDATATALPASALRDSVVDVVAADFDDDGITDLLMASSNEFGLPSRILRGRGDGTFAVGSTVSELDATSANTVFARDLDEDGVFDVLWLRQANAPFSPPRVLGLLLGRRGGGFVDASTRVTLPSTALFGRGQPALADFDGDGDLDLVAFVAPTIDPAAPMPVLVVNHHRQLTATEGPRRGAVWTQRVHAKPGYASAPHLAVPILGLAPASVALPPLGTLRVDLQSGVTLPPFVVPTSPGHADIGLAIPNDRSLLGVRVVTQALVVDLVAGAKFTNALVERVR